MNEGEISCEEATGYAVAARRAYSRRGVFLKMGESSDLKHDRSWVVKFGMRHNVKFSVQSETRKMLPLPVDFHTESNFITSLSTNTCLETHSRSDKY